VGVLDIQNDGEKKSGKSQVTLKSPIVYVPFRLTKIEQSRFLRLKNNYFQLLPIMSISAYSKLAVNGHYPTTDLGDTKQPTTKQT